MYTATPRRFRTTTSTAHDAKEPNVSPSLNARATRRENSHPRHDGRQPKTRHLTLGLLFTLHEHDDDEIAATDRE
jgi:hypothetical protein